jgi:hypothetical protein
MRFLADLFSGLLMAAVLLAGLVTFASGVSEPERRGTLAIAGAVLLGAAMITLAILNRPGDGDH